MSCDLVPVISSSRPSVGLEVSTVPPLRFSASIAGLLDPVTCCLKDRDDWVAFGRVVLDGCKRDGCANVVNAEEDG